MLPLARRSSRILDRLGKLLVRTAKADPSHVHILSTSKLLVATLTVATPSSSRRAKVAKPEGLARRTSRQSSTCANGLIRLLTRQHARRVSVRSRVQSKEEMGGSWSKNFVEKVEGKAINHGGRRE